jgi:hypothetical protein
VTRARPPSWLARPFAVIVVRQNPGEGHGNRRAQAVLARAAHSVGRDPRPSSDRQSTRAARNSRGTLSTGKIGAEWRLLGRAHRKVTTTEEGGMLEAFKRLHLWVGS